MNIFIPPESFVMRVAHKNKKQMLAFSPFVA